MTSAVDLLPVLWACRYDTDYNVWVAVLDAASGLRDVADAVSPLLGAVVLRFTASLIAPIVESVGWEAKPGEPAGIFACGDEGTPTMPTCADTNR